jgi:hypothetical protein
VGACAALTLSALVVAAALTQAVAPAPAAPALVWEATGFVAPESAVFDAARQLFYVSNMGSWGDGATRGDGFVSRVSADGRIVDLRWITGLQNPKGLALANGRLYAADDAELIEIDPAAGAIVARYAPRDGPGGFNDCTAAPDGTVYVFSRRLATVFRLRGGRFEAWATVDLAQTGAPNGLLAERDRLLLGSWWVRAPGAEPRLGHLSTVGYADGAVGRLGDRPIGHIDGIEPDGRGGYTVTDWTKGELLRVSADGVPSLLLTLKQGAADHTYVIDRALLVVPLVLDGAVRAYRWTPDAR